MHLLICSPKCLYSLGLSQAEARSSESIQVSHMVGRAPSTWPFMCCFPECISRKLDRKQSCQDLNPHPPKWDAGIMSSSLTPWATVPALVLTIFFVPPPGLALIELVHNSLVRGETWLLSWLPALVGILSGLEAQVIEPSQNFCYLYSRGEKWQMQTENCGHFSRQQKLPLPLWLQEAQWRNDTRTNQRQWRNRLAEDGYFL